MGSTDLILAICIITPLAMMLFVFQGRSRVVLGFLLCGIFMCLLAGEINGLLLTLTGRTKYFMTVNITPIVEEVLKAVPIVFITFLLKPDRQFLLECSVAVGVGFAVLENAYILSTLRSVSVVWALVRGFGAGMTHGVCTLAVGCAMSFVYGKRKLFFPGSFAALSVAIIYHSIYNIIVQSPYSICGILLPIATYIPLMLIIYRRKAAAAPTEFPERTEL